MFFGLFFFNNIQNGSKSGSKRLPTSFSTVTSQKVGITHRNILTFSFKYFFLPQCYKVFKVTAITNPTLLNLNQDHL